MKQIFILLFLICFFYVKNSFSSAIINGYALNFYSLKQQDTLKKNQLLYTGKVWKNKFRRVNGDQFLFTNYFLPGTISIAGKTIKNLLIKFDIYADEILIPVDLDEVVQVNKEMVDSFSIRYENFTYRFEKFNDSLEKKLDVNGYLCVLYKGETALYIKYGKYIMPNITDKSDGEFIETRKVYLVKDKTLYPILSITDLSKALNIDKQVMKNFLKKNKLKILMNNPVSIIPIIRFYDDLSH